MSGARILVVDDEADIRNLIQEILSEEGYDVTTAANAAQAREAVESRAPDLILLDIWMPDTDGISLLREWQQERSLNCPVVILSGHGTVETAVEATRLGAADFVEKPLSLNKLLRTVEKALRGARTTSRSADDRALLPPLFATLARSRQIRELRQKAEQFAPHSAPGLIAGESGTGRGALARFIHDAGPRSAQPFVSVAGAAMIAGNAANMILGAETAAGKEPGLVERADAGTLFISGIEDASPEAQTLLVSLAETGSYTPIGRAEPQPVRARFLISAQPSAVASPQGCGLRPDLVQRLGVLRIEVPPLRDYAEDVSDLLRYTVEDLVERQHLSYRRFSFAAQNRLRNYPWPGNLLELNGLVTRLLSAGGPEEISLAEVEKELMPAQAVQQPLVKQDLLSLTLREARENFERAYLTEQLALCGGKVGQLAKRVGMERTHLYRKLRSLGVDFRGALNEE